MLHAVVGADMMRVGSIATKASCVARIKCLTLISLAFGVILSDVHNSVLASGHDINLMKLIARTDY